MSPLRITLLWMCAATGIAVYGVMIYSIVAFRRSRANVPARFDRRTLAEVLWATVAIIIVMGAVAPAVKEAVFDKGRQSPASARA